MSDYTEKRGKLWRAIEEEQKKPVALRRTGQIKKWKAAIIALDKRKMRN